MNATLTRIARHAALGTMAAVVSMGAWASESSSYLSSSWTYTFGELISGQGAPEELTFATLVVTETGKDVTFKLTASGLDKFSGSSPFVGGLAVETTDGSSLGSVTNVQGGVKTLDVSKGSGPGGEWDGVFSFGQGNNDRLTDNETVSWTWTGGAGHWEEFAIHVQGLSYGGTTSAWYEVGDGNTTPKTPLAPVMAVPEPDAQAMLALGLAVLALRRRKKA